MGQLGSAAGPSSEVPAQVIGLSSGVEQVSGGGQHSCANMDNGSVKCWGANGHGELGNGELYGINVEPVDVIELDHESVMVTAGSGVSCSLSSEGTVKCWGKGSSTGDSTSAQTSTPVDVVGLSESVFEISTHSHTCVVLANGQMECWGANWDGELGNGTNEHALSPVEVLNLDSIVTNTAGGGHTCAVDDEGSVWCWGCNNRGELGLGYVEGEHYTPMRVEGLADEAASVCSSYHHTCAVMKNGAMKCWGSNGGQLGDGIDTSECIEWYDCRFPDPVDVIGFGPGSDADASK